jgi:hypothetical protein
MTQAAYASVQPYMLPLVPISGRQPRWSCHVVHELGSSAPANRNKALEHMETRAGLEVEHLSQQSLGPGCPKALLGIVFHGRSRSPDMYKP